MMPETHISEEDRAWAAGFFDGEGCVHISAYRPKDATSKMGASYTIHVTAAQTVPAPLLKMQRLFGGYLSNPRRSDRKKGAASWSITSSQQAKRALLLMLPYLQVKFFHAIVVFLFLEWRDSFRKRGRGRTYLPEERAILERLRARLKRFNSREFKRECAEGFFKGKTYLSAVSLRAGGSGRVGEEICRGARQQSGGRLAGSAGNPDEQP